MNIEERIIEIKKEIGKLFLEKYQSEIKTKELTQELKEKQKELFELELEKKKEDMRGRYL